MVRAAAGLGPPLALSCRLAPLFFDNARATGHREVSRTLTIYTEMLNVDLSELEDSPPAG